MPDRSNVIYRSDGSFNGLLCCVFESFARRELPAAILTGAEEQCSLLPVREIPTDPQKAARVRASIPGRLGAATGRLIESAFLYGGEGRELAILELMRAGYRLGPRVASMLDLPEVQTVFSMRRAVENEAHHLTGFVRFSEIRGALVSVIAPRHFVLPLLAEHFCGRFCEERLLLYDRTHRAALFYQPYAAQIREMESFEPAAPDQEELRFRRMWEDYFHATAIGTRANPACQMGHMPKRFWAHLTEMQRQPDFRLSPEKTFLK